MSITITKSNASAIIKSSTHFAPVKDRRGWLYLFVVEPCERCGADVVAPNLSQLRMSAKDALAVNPGLTKLAAMPTNEHNPMDDGSMCCSLCYSEAFAELKAREDEERAAAETTEETPAETTEETPAETTEETPAETTEETPDAAGNASVVRSYVVGKDGFVQFCVTLPGDSRPMVRFRAASVAKGVYGVASDVYVVRGDVEGWALGETGEELDKTRSFYAARDMALKFALAENRDLALAALAARTEAVPADADLYADPAPAKVRVAQDQPKFKAPRKAAKPRAKVYAKLTVDADGNVLSAPADRDALLKLQEALAALVSAAE